MKVLDLVRDHHLFYFAYAGGRLDGRSKTDSFDSEIRSPAASRDTDCFEMKARMVLRKLLTVVGFGKDGTK
jgi:hypothetical protein